MKRESGSGRPVCQGNKGSGGTGHAGRHGKEIALGFEPRDVSAEKCGYDIESRVPGTGKLRFIEVKGRVAGARTITVTKNEILTALNKPDDYILAVVTVENNQVTGLTYLTRPFKNQPDFAATSVNYDLNELLNRGEQLA